jgi:hypothetical protein
MRISLKSELLGTHAPRGTHAGIVRSDGHVGLVKVVVVLFKPGLRPL